MQISLLQNEQQLESLYFHQSSDLTITVQGDGVEKKEYVASPPTDAQNNRQFISHWVTSEGSIQLKTERVVREEVFPHAEEVLKEAKERDGQNAKKAFATLEKEYMKK